MPADDLIGSVIDGRFEVRVKIGVGGMGTVYRAFQRSVKREVAIKVIKPALSSDPMVVKRFEREAELASRLSQPNTVSVFDYGRTEDGRLFIAMELIKGRTLLQVLAGDGPLPVDRVVRIGSQIFDALEAAHALGIVHRDLKLENMILLHDPPGRDLLKVLDFGLAKVHGDVSVSGGSAVVGTPRYMAPEVATAGETSPASDIYAAGVILGELALGDALWTTSSMAKLVAQKLHPEATIERVPPALRRPLGALLDPDRTRRPTAAQARTLLRTVADGSISFPPPPRPESPPAERRRPRVRWPFVVLALAAAAAAAYLLATGQLTVPSG